MRSEIDGHRQTVGTLEHGLHGNSPHTSRHKCFIFPSVRCKLSLLATLFKMGKEASGWLRE